MAISNWETLVIKNGRVMNRGTMFQDMKCTVGWADDESMYIDEDTGICNTHKLGNKNMFAFIGDEEFTLGFYKVNINIYENKEFKNVYYSYCNAENIVNRINYRLASGQEVNIKIKRLDRSTYHLSMKYKGDWYDVIYGQNVSNSPYSWEVMKRIKWCTRKEARKVDNLMRKLIKDDGVKVIIDALYGSEENLKHIIKDYQINSTYNGKYSGPGFVLGDSEDMLYLVNLIYNIYLDDDESVDFTDVLSSLMSLEEIASVLNDYCEYEKFIVKYVTDLK